MNDGGNLFPPPYAIEAAIHIAVHNNVAYEVFPMTYSAVRALYLVKSTLERWAVKAAV
jgi:hypothetical protein